MLVTPISYILLDNGFSIITPLIVYIIATVLCFVIEMYYLKKWIQASVFGLFKNTIIPVTIIVFLSIIPVYTMAKYSNESFINFIFISFVAVVSVGLLVYFIALNKDEKIKMKLMIKNKIKGKKNEKNI